jgi:hypothetical protein
LEAAVCVRVASTPCPDGRRPPRRARHETSGAKPSGSMSPP